MNVSTFIGIIILVNGKFWKYVQHTVNSGSIWGEQWDWKRADRKGTSSLLFIL